MLDLRLHLRQMERTVSTPDGRVLRVETAGELDGLPVLIHHGTPGSGHAYGPHVADATSRGACLIAYDRPGYGGSTPQPGRTVADTAEDVRTIARELGHPLIAVWGISGGGPQALACAALLPDLVVAAASLASPAPYGVPDLDYFAGMGQENVDDIKLTLTDPTRARRKAVQDREILLSRSVEDMVNAFPTLVSPADASVNTREALEYLHRWTHDGLAPGIEGWWEDGISQVRPWGFELESIRIPVQLWHGRQDWFVPFQHGEWLAKHIPGVDAHLTETDGHLTLLQSRIPEVHEFLLAHF